ARDRLHSPSQVDGVTGSLRVGPEVPRVSVERDHIAIPIKRDTGAASHHHSQFLVGEVGVLRVRTEEPLLVLERDHISRPRKINCRYAWARVSLHSRLAVG